MSEREAHRIIFVPGMKPKPPADRYGSALSRCLAHSVSKVSPAAAERLLARQSCFEVASWTQDFYDEHRDIGEDMDDIAAALEKDGPDDRDRAQARAWRTRLKRFSYLVGDALPFLIPRFADEDLRLTLADVLRYLRNEGNVGRRIRRNLREPLARARETDARVLIIGHSLGSVIAWDTLWELSRVDGVGGKIELFVTLGSPLGQRIIQRQLKGSGDSGRRKYPSNIRRWLNVAAVGELTAIDHRFARDFAPMQKYGLVESIEDRRIYSHYRQNGVLAVHNEYGYLLADEVGAAVAQFMTGS